MYRPIKDLLARGTYAQGFRAPTISDIAGGGSQTFDSYLDPCDSVYGAAASDPTVKGRCSAAGLPANFRQLNQGGNPVSGGGAQGTVPFYSGVGNTSLQPETATTKTIGLVYSPSWLTGFSATIDYFDIAVHNRITGVSAAYELGQCYVQGVQSFCDKFSRDKTTGQISGLNRGNANLGELRTKGFDLDVSYRFKRTAYGQFTIRSDSTYVDKYSIKSTPTSDWINYSGEWGIDRLKSNTHLDWNFGNWSATWTAHYYSKLKDRCWSTTVECNSPGLGASFGTNVNRLGSETYHDLSVAYAFPWNGKLMVGANNLFDKAPRLELLSSSSYGGTSSSSAVNPDRPIDRFVYVRYNQSF
jgi:iron complex outermembrane recepter protein